MAGKKEEESAGLVELLRKADRNSGLSTHQFAAACGVDSGTLSRFVCGERTITVETAEKVCRASRLTPVSEGPPAAAATSEERAAPKKPGPTSDRLK